MFIGFFNYFETGCGIRIFVRTGKTIEDIKKDVDDYYLIGLQTMKIETFIETIKDPNKATETDRQSADELLDLLKLNCPFAYEKLISYHYIDIDYTYAINLS